MGKIGLLSCALLIATSLPFSACYADEIYTYLCANCSPQNNTLKIVAKQVLNEEKSVESHGVLSSSDNNDRRFIVSYLVNNGDCVLRSGDKINISTYADQGSLSGRCGHNPADYIEIRINDKILLKEIVHAKCGGQLFKSAEITDSKVTFCKYTETSYHSDWTPDIPEPKLECKDINISKLN